MLKKKKIFSEIIETDIVIIGAGTHGLLLYDQLKSKYKKIKIIERGDENAKKIKSNDIKFFGKFHNGTSNARAFGVGGNSTLWGGQLVEFLKEDIDNKKYYWGTSYHELKKLYLRLYNIFNIHKVTSKDYIKSKSIKLQIKGINYFFTNWLKEPNFIKYFKKNHINNKDIITNARIEKINFNKKTATNIELMVSNKRVKILGKRFIFSCGTVENAKFFLENKINSPWSSNNNIGNYFQDHLGLFIGNVKLINEALFSLLFDNGFFEGSKYQPKLREMSESNFNRLGISGEFKSFSKHDSNLSQLKSNIKDMTKNFSILNLYRTIKSFIPLSPILGNMTYNFIKYKKIRSYSDKGIKFYVQCEQLPLYQSSIKKDYNGKKMNYAIKWKIKGDEIKIIKNFVKKVQIFLKINKIAIIDDRKLYKFSNKKIFNQIRDTNHPCGGMVISKNKKTGVVDKNCKVWNTNNIFIAGASIFPKSSFANTTLTSLAFALKLSDHLKKNV
tara:strand:+ start:125 stop:1624 length:1500 start_codon:yes stop_codon:yes gene_type:complete